MNTVEIYLTELIGVTRKREYVRVGVPCAKGAYFGTEELQLCSPSNEVLPVQTTILKKWHDGSIKWLLLDFAATVSSHERVLYRLCNSNRPLPTEPNPITITKSPDQWRIATGKAEFVIDTNVFRPFKSITINKVDVLAAGAFCLLGLEERHVKPLVESIGTEAEGPLRAIVRLEGCFNSDKSMSPRFVCRIHFFAESSQIMLELTLHNPRSAAHPGGLWDLGDSGSLLFKELALLFPLAGAGNNRIVCSPEQGRDSQHLKSLPTDMRIYQESSGGENWNSPVHRTRDGNVRIRFNGYEVTTGGNKIADGKRATPVVWCGEGEVGVSAVMPHFWQEFPKAFSVDATGLKVELFPVGAPDLHELQGGEQKTTTIYLDFASAPDGLAWARSPLVVAPSPGTCHSSGVFSDLPPIPGTSHDTDLVDQFITADELLNKREIVDEYGWRNFGDFYADHEALYHKGDVTFVSHYNNQYDGIGGAYRKFLATGDPNWGALASDLARHVSDIDINHTDQDREEYNQGLFWHTDHYVDAGLSTHRSCSIEHLKVKDPRFCGGGPGAEHCYTTGLTYHYFQTGNPAFRKTVIDLAEWELCSLSGPATVLAVLKKSMSYISLLRSTRNDTRLIFPTYPLTRGTGNALTACLDAYEVSGDTKFLKEAEGLIRGALHPDDDIATRDLLNAEVAWSYTVLLSAVAKFINKKMELDQCDSGYEYAKAGLLAYTEWMLTHEYPYLEKPEILEYPNETWAAQDLRKSVIFYYAAHYAIADQVQAFKERAKFFYNSASRELARHTSSSFTRPVVLMLQNGWIGSKLYSEAIPSLKNGAVSELSKGSDFGRPTPYLKLSTIIGRTVAELLRAAQQTSIKREVAWLKARIN